ncbi:hypothetical protein [Actinacidiphila sp. ITFR-21]|uniref:hypothetical protein n=1 Tax=Actinacidiphila sp. ITFR-21 TaxID=3075199 RepID=UPI00288B60DC|nr:hypothetical protein [Streptomyces sp. ITFR-21]WNI15725.1 hypothetical protein RLT57_09440 [Streptomyces sp. ITFR-21]
MFGSKKRAAQDEFDRQQQQFRADVRATEQRDLRRATADAASAQSDLDTWTHRIHTSGQSVAKDIAVQGRADAQGRLREAQQREEYIRRNWSS